VTLHTHRDSTLVVFGDSLSDNGNLFNLIGMPSAPYWEGRSSNGPNYAEQLAKLMHMQLDDRAYAFAEASDASPALLTDPSAIRFRSTFPIRSMDISPDCMAIRRRTTPPR
jgi:hypothetical protein